MHWFSLLVMVVISLAAVVYTQIRLSRLTASRNQAWVARAALALVGLGFGWTVLVQIGQPTGSATQAMLFVAAFGLVHVPAAIILLLKTWQRRDPPIR